MGKKPKALWKLYTIDFEYGCESYAGFDIANHFCEHFIDNNHPTYPGFMLDEKQFPSQVHCERFIRVYLTYLKEYKKKEEEKTTEAGAGAAGAGAAGAGAGTGTGASSRNRSSEDGSDLIVDAAHISAAEVRRWYNLSMWFVLPSHLLWSIWALIQAERSTIAFGYAEYAQARMKHYYELKQQLLQQQKQPQQQ